MSNDAKPTQGTTRIVDPTVRFIAQLIEGLESGEIFIPRFQRGDVWDDEDRLDLLNSIQRYIPIGSLMLWRTQLKVATKTQIGGHVLPEPPTQPPNSFRDYVLDGLQRLSTLLRLLAASGKPQPLELLADADEEQGGGDYYYDLRIEIFRVRRKEAVECWHLPTTILLHTMPLLAFQRRLGDAMQADAAVLLERSDRLANAFRTYKIPVVFLATNRLEDATSAFQRINVKGSTMSEVHMLNALTFTGDYDLERELEVLRPTLARVGWGDLDAKYLLATVRALCGLDVTLPNAERLQHEIRDRPEVISQAVNALARAAELLRNHCYVPSPYWVPYAYQAVFLAYALRNPAPKAPADVVEKALADWFWKTSYTDFLRTGSRYHAQLRTMAVLDKIREGTAVNWEDTRGMTVEVLPDRMNFRTARVKLLCLRLAAMKPRDLVNNEPFNVLDMMALHQSDAFMLVAPSRPEHLRSSSPENRLLYPPESAENLIDRVLLLGDPHDTALKSHFLNRVCLERLREGDFEGCLAERLQLMWDSEAAHLRHLQLKPTIER